jgi:hypothetical protein
MDQQCVVVVVGHHANILAQIHLGDRGGNDLGILTGAGRARLAPPKPSVPVVEPKVPVMAPNPGVVWVAVKAGATPLPTGPYWSMTAAHTTH